MRSLLRIARALPPLERAYALARFAILRMKLLAVMDLLLPAEGELLDVGCGFGLFSSYFSLMEPGRRITGIDRSPRRISLARDVASRLELSTRFIEGDVSSFPLERRFDAIYVLDVLHHIPWAQQPQLLDRLVGALRPHGVLLIKDITTKPVSGRLFTQVLDRAVVGLSAPLAYRHHGEWCAILQTLGVGTRVIRVPDILPYPHVVIAARKGP